MAIAVLGLSTIGLSACPNRPDDSGYGTEPAINLTMPKNVTKYELDTTDYSKQEEKKTDTIKIFYHRNDNDDQYSNYFKYRLWIWDKGNGGNGWWYEFTKYNKYGVIAEIPLKDITGEEGKLTSEIGMVITTCQSQTATWEGTYSKDPDGDIIAEVQGMNKGGVQCIYTITKKARAFYREESPFRSNLSYTRYADKKTVHVVFDCPDKTFVPKNKSFELTVNGEKVTDFTVGEFDKSAFALDLTLKKEVKITDVINVIYHFSNEREDNSTAILTKIYDEEEFTSKYLYDGNDLGVTFDNELNPTKTTFKVWSPVSTKMVLNVYNTGDYRTETAPASTYEMTMGNKGVWEYTVNSDLSSKYYTFTVTNVMGTNEVVDPYAKSAGLNGRRGMVTNFKKINATISGWDTDTRPDFGENGTDATISEIHVRDMTINPNSGVTAENRGKFLGLAEKNTTYSDGGVEVSTGLDHLKELGVSHVQIQPMYDYSSVDESTLDTTMGDDNYNWGYDPLNYNVLEGSYSSDPCDGEARIKEAKQMIMAMHDSGININMDVVYNHTSALQGSNFELLMPNYYHRTKAGGAAYTGSGCGNEVATERYMVNKFIRESCKFWIDEYHISGFRFDLMGLMDNQIMIDIYKDCKAIYDKIMVYGEPWTGGTSKLKGGTDPNKLLEQQTVQSSLGQSYFVGDNVFVGAFSDGFRNAVKGDNGPGQGYVQGDKNKANSILAGIKGKFAEGNNAEPQQVLNYVSCHDNYTLYDQLVQTMTGEDAIKQAYLQAESFVFLSQGVAFIQEGEEFMRSKKLADGKYCGNSYNVGDTANNMDYSLKLKNYSLFSKVKELINFRKENPAFTIPTAAGIRSAITDIVASNGNIKFSISYNGDKYVVIHALTPQTYALNNCNVVYSTLSNNGTGITSYAVSKNETVVFKVN